jgi:hypothetical protein
MADDRTYIKLHDGMPRHPKVRGLSDKAFRTFVSALCYCSEYLTDGEVVSAVAKDLGPPKAWAELVSSGLAEAAPGGYLMHDYLEHQRSAQEIAELKEKRRAAGKLGGRPRGSRSKASPKASAKQVLSNVRLQVGNGDSSATLNSGTDDAPTGGQNPRGSGTFGNQTLKQTSKQNESKNNPETESLTNVRDQAETDTSSLRSDVDAPDGATPPKSTRRKPARALPEDFVITSAMRDWHRAKGLSDHDADRQTERFKSNALAKDNRYANWEQAWRNWIDQAIDWGHVKAGPQLVATDGQRAWSAAELDAVLGVDMWRLPQPPRHLKDDAIWEWEQRTKREHRAERIREAEAKLGRSA